MRIKQLTISVLMLALIASCNPLKKMYNHQDTMEEAYNAGNYEQVLVSYNQLENFHEANDTEVKTDYTKMAAKSALETEQYQQAEDLLQQWIEKTDDFEPIELLGSVYEKTGKTDLEYKHWNRYWDRIESEDLKKEVGTRLFTIEMDKKEYDKALERAKKMPPMSDPKIRFMRVEALDARDEKEEAREICNDILEKNPDFKPAMAWKARDIYERAEEWYKAEMTEYEKNPEYTAYVYLRRELKKISAMYRESRDLFEKLHQDDPDNQTYIKYLKNIYLRLEMREEATKMDMLLENQR